MCCFGGRWLTAGPQVCGEARGSGCSVGVPGMSSIARARLGPTCAFNITTLMAILPGA